MRTSFLLCVLIHLLFWNTNKSRIYSFKIEHGNTVVCKMVPCRSDDGANLIGYMYDIARDRLFWNVGSGDFVIGPDVEGE